MQNARSHLINRLLQLVGLQFQELFHSPSGVLFTTSLTVLVHYRQLSRIQPWRVVPPDSNKVSRASPYSGTSQRQIVFVYRTITYFGQPFQGYSTNNLFSNSLWMPYNPNSVKTELVWALSRSLAATKEISFDFYSFRYLDGSVP